MSFQTIRKYSSSRSNTKIKELLDRLARFQASQLQIEDEDLILLGFSDHSRLTYHDDMIFTKLTTLDATAYKMPVEPDGKDLTLWYRFDGLSTLEDKSYFGHDGTIIGDPQCKDTLLVEGIDEGMNMGGNFAVEFNGINQYAKTPTSTKIDITGDTVGFSIFMRFKIIKDLTTDQILFQKIDDITPNYGYEAWIKAFPSNTNWISENYLEDNYGAPNTTELIFIVKWNGAFIKVQTTTAFINTNTWYDAWFKFDKVALTATMYIDNILQNTASTATPNMVAATDTSLFIATSNRTTGYFQGYIQDFRFWNERLISLTEIENQFDNKLTISNIDFNKSAVVGYSVIPQAFLAKVNEPRFFGYFDGIDDRITITNSTSLNTFSQLSISLWVYPESWGDTQFSTIFDKTIWANGTFTLYIDNISKLWVWAQQNDIGVRTSSISAANSVKLNQWYHVVVVYDGATHKLYINNVLVDTDAATGTMTNTGNLIVAGSTTDFRGKLSDLRLYKDRIITTDEISDLYSGNDIGMDNLSLWYDFHEGGGTSVYDRSGNGNTGTSVGMVYRRPVNFLTFNGANGYVDVGDIAALEVGETTGSAMSYSFWIRIPTIPTITAVPVGKGDIGGVVPYINADDTKLRVNFLYETLTTWTAITNVTVVDGLWHHVVITHSDVTNISKVYVDDVMTVSNAANDFLEQTLTRKFTIGAWDNGTIIDYWPGDIRDVRVYNTELLQANVTTLFNGKDFTTGQVGRWKLDDDRNNSAKVLDSQSTNHGTISGGVTFVPDVPNSYTSINPTLPIVDKLTALKLPTNPILRTITDTTAISDSLAALKNVIKPAIPATETVPISDTLAVQKLSLQVKLGRITKSTETTGLPFTQSFSNELGFTPKFIIFWGANSIAVNTYSGRYENNFGFTDGVNDRGFACASEDGVGFSNSTHMWFNFALVDIGVNGTFQYKATCSFDPNGFTLNYTLNNDKADIINYIAFGGTTITNVSVGGYAMPATATGNHSKTGLGFQPTAIMFMPTNYDVDNSQGIGVFWSLGFAKSSTQRNLIGNWNTDSFDTSDCRRYMRDNRCVLRIDDAAIGLVQKEADLVSMDAGGWTLNFTTNSGTADLLNYLAFKGPQVFVGKFATGSTTGNKSVTGVGFKPKAVLVYGHGLAPQAGQPFISNAKYCFGAATSSIDRKCCASHDKDAVGTTESAVITHNNRFIKIFTANTISTDSTTDFEADFVSMDSDGFTYNVKTTDGTGRDFLFMAIGQ